MQNPRLKKLELKRFSAGAAPPKLQAARAYDADDALAFDIDLTWDSELSAELELVVAGGEGSKGGSGGVGGGRGSAEYRKESGGADRFRAGESRGVLGNPGGKIDQGLDGRGVVVSEEQGEAG